MEKQHFLNHRKRLKERFEKAPYGLPDSEIVELLLGYVIKGKDVKPQSKDIISAAKNISNIFSINLLDIKGIGKETSLFFNILQEFINRYTFQKVASEPISFHNSDIVSDFLKSKIGHSKKEVFIIIFLDNKNRLKSYKVVREGFINNVPMAARDIIEEAIKNNSVSIIIAHNHTSGDCMPSDADFKVTREICHALQYTGITLLDHLVTSAVDSYSMNTNGYIEMFYNDVKLKG